jgi:hypothetical protein
LSNDFGVSAGVKLCGGVKCELILELYDYLLSIPEILCFLHLCASGILREWRCKRHGGQTLRLKTGLLYKCLYDMRQSKIHGVSWPGIFGRAPATRPVVLRRTHAEKYAY